MQANKNDFYNGNARIKKAGVKQSFTADQLNEYIKCQNDIVYFIKNYCKIISLDEGLVLFELRDYQERMIRAYDSNRFNITLTSRQIGKTTVVAAYLIHYLIFNEQKSVAILANKAATSREILSRVKRMLEGLPFFLQPGVKEYNKGSVEFGNGSKVLASATSSDSIRGFTFNLVYLDEFAFVEGADDFYTSTYPVISSGKDTKIIITSTPNGMNLFYKLWMDGKNGENEFNCVRVDWWEIPHYDEAWKEMTIRNIGEKKFSQEYGNSFFGSSGTLIDGATLERLVWKKPIEETENVKIWKRPVPGHVYIATVDVSEGAGSDYSVMNIIDITTSPYEQVCVFRNNKTTPLVFPEIIERLAKEYNEAWILVETNSIGAQVANILYFDYEYENMIITNVKAGDNVVSGGFAGNVDYGLRTTKKSKRIGCSNLKSLIENNLLILNDFDAISELQTFSKKGTSYEAEDGKNDDIVMTLVILGWVSTQDYFKDLMNFDSRKQILEMKMQAIEDELTPVGFFNDAAEQAEESYSVYDEYHNVY